MRRQYSYRIKQSGKYAGLGKRNTVNNATTRWGSIIGTVSNWGRKPFVFLHDTMILHKKIPIKTDRKEETKAIYKLITVLLSKFPEDEGELPEIKSEKY